MIDLSNLDWGWSHNPVDAKCDFAFDMFWWLQPRQKIVDALDIDRCKNE